MRITSYYQHTGTNQSFFRKKGMAYSSFSHGKPVLNGILIHTLRKITILLCCILGRTRNKMIYCNINFLFIKNSVYSPFM